MNGLRWAALVLAALAVITVGAPLWTGWLGVDPYSISAAGRFQPANLPHWWGTDAIGRDLFARVLYGARTSFAVALGAALGAAVVGGGLGAFAGFVGGWFDEIVARATEATIAIPKLPLLLMLAAIEVPGGTAGRLVLLIGLLVLMAWPGPARLARSTAMQCRRSGFVVASRALGASPSWIWWWHVWPRTVPVLAVGAAGDVAELILFESVLSYLGFGIPEPAPSLGNLLSGGLTLLFEAPQAVVIPGVLTVSAVAALHVLADRTAQRIDPFRFSPEREGPASVEGRDG